MAEQNRRTFLKSSVTAAAGMMLASPVSTTANPKGANDRINVAVAGIRSRGRVGRGLVRLFDGCFHGVRIAGAGGLPGLMSQFALAFESVRPGLF